MPTIGDLTTLPAGTAAGAGAAGAAGSAAAAGAAAAATTVGARGAAAAATIVTGAGPALTMRTLPSASVISSSEMFESDTRSISVFSFLRSIFRSS